MTESPAAPAPARRIKRGWMNLKVADVVRETHDTDTFILVDADEGGRPFDYVAGQYLTFRFDDVGPKPIVRSYTMSSSPNQEDFSAFTVKRVEGGQISNWLCDNVKVGSILRARGPIGKFVYDPTQDAERVVMVAGGSGVTPFVSIMRAYVDSIGRPGSPKQMTLLISYRSKEDLICWKELTQFKAVPGMTVHTTLTREDKTREGFWHGRITDEHIKRAVGGTYADTTYMSCGPTAIMNHAAAHFRAAGVPEHRIKTESFES